MAVKKNIKQIMLNTLWIVLGITIVIVLVAAMQKKKNSLCADVKVSILSNHDQLFLNEQDILDLIKAKDIINKKTVSEIDIKALEQQLEKNVWMDNVELFFDKLNVLNIEVTERTPLFRIFRQNGNSFYMDKEHFVLPLSNAYSAKVPLFTGFGDNAALTGKDTSLLESIHKLAAYIYADSFWMAQIQQINILRNEEFEIEPTIGKHTIVFGDTSDMQAKFNKLFKFYRTVSAKVGFDKYTILNVKFKNQIVATTNMYKPIDTSKANQAIQQFIRNNSDSILQFVDTANVNSNAATVLDTTIKNDNAPKPTVTAPKPVVTAPKPTATAPKPNLPHAVAVPPKPVSRNNRINNNTPKPTTPPRAVMPKRNGNARPKQ